MVEVIKGISNVRNKILRPNNKEQQLLAEPVSNNAMNNIAKYR